MAQELLDAVCDVARERAGRGAYAESRRQLARLLDGQNHSGVDLPSLRTRVLLGGRVTREPRHQEQVDRLCSLVFDGDLLDRVRAAGEGAELERVADETLALLEQRIDAQASHRQVIVASAAAAD